MEWVVLHASWPTHHYYGMGCVDQSGPHTTLSFLTKFTFYIAQLWEWISKYFISGLYASSTDSTMISWKFIIARLQLE